MLHQVLGQDTHLLKLNRPLSGRWAGEVEQKFRDISSGGAKRVILNLEEVPLIDSDGLAALVAGLQIFGGQAQNLQLVGPQAQPQLLFELTGFDKIFQIVEESIPLALAA